MLDFLNDLKDKALDVWRRAPTVVVVCGVGLLLLCSTCCMCGGCLGTFMGSGDSSSGEGSRSSSRATSARATHVVTEDACLYLFPASAGDSHDNEVTISFFYQHTGDPLAGKDMDKAIVLKEGTGVELKKTVMRQLTSGGVYQVYFVEVVSGEYGGERGWIHEKYLLRE